MAPTFLLLLALAPAEPPVPCLELEVAAVGEAGVHPGGLVGVELPLVDFGAQRLFVDVEGGAYLHPKSHRAAFVFGALGYRLSLSAHFDVEAALGPGALHTFLEGDVYVPSARGAKRAVDLGRPSFAPALALGVGFRPFGGTVRLFARARAVAVLPFDGGILPRVLVEGGVTIPLTKRPSQ